MEKTLCKGDVVCSGTREYRLLEDPVMNQDKLNWHVLAAEMNVPGDARRFMKYTLKDNVAAYLPLKRESKFRIRYPYIERVYDYFETSGPLGREAAFLIAEYEDGVDLREFICREGGQGEDTRFRNGSIFPICSSFCMRLIITAAITGRIRWCTGT